MLHSPIASPTQQRASLVKECSADRDSTFLQPESGFSYCNREKFVKVHSHLDEF